MAARIAGGSTVDGRRRRAFAGTPARDRLPLLMSAQDTPSAWTPILSPDVAESVLRGVEEIADALRATLDQPRPQEPTWLRRGPSLAGGDAGLACFFLSFVPSPPRRGGKPPASPPRQPA